MLALALRESYNILSVSLEGILCLYINTARLQIFGKGIGIHLMYHVPATERCRYLAAQHLGITTRDLNLIFLIC